MSEFKITDSKYRTEITFTYFEDNVMNCELRTDDPDNLTYFTYLDITIQQAKDLIAFLQEKIQLAENKK